MSVVERQHEFHVVVEKGEDGYFIGSVIELPGCHTQAKTLEELDKRIKEAAELYLETEGEHLALSEFVTLKKIRV